MIDLQNYRLIILFAVILLLSGCGKNVKTARVNGNVTLDGKSISEGTILFQSDRYTCAAPIENGKFELKFQGGSKVPAALYRVAVVPNADSREDVPPGELIDQEGRQSEAINLMYQSPETSGIERDVKNGDNEFSIDLKSSL